MSSPHTLRLGTVGCILEALDGEIWGRLHESDKIWGMPNAVQSWSSEARVGMIADCMQNIETRDEVVLLRHLGRDINIRCLRKRREKSMSWKERPE